MQNFFKGIIFFRTLLLLSHLKPTVMNTKKTKSDRRKFLGNIAGGAAALGLLSIPSSIKAAPSLFQDADDTEALFKNLKSFSEAENPLSNFFQDGIVFR